jgi:hypothetical protein
MRRKKYSEQGHWYDSYGVDFSQTQWDFLHITSACCPYFFHCTSLSLLRSMEKIRLYDALDTIKIDVSNISAAAAAKCIEKFLHSGKD